jgi:hypothetical protein
VDGAADTLVRPAATKRTRHGGVNLFIGWRRVRVEQSNGRHDLSRLAITALRDAFFYPGLLHGVTAVHRQPLNRRNLPAGYGGNGHHARSLCLAIHVHRATTTLTNTTTVLGARQTQDIPQRPQQRHVRRRLYLLFLTIDKD